MYGESFKEVGDIVDVEVDLSYKTIRFFKNGIDQGIAFDEIPDNCTYYAAVSLYEDKDKVTLLQNSENCEMRHEN